MADSALSTHMRPVRPVKRLKLSFAIRFFLRNSGVKMPIGLEVKAFFSRLASLPPNNVQNIANNFNFHSKIVGRKARGARRTQTFLCAQEYWLNVFIIQGYLYSLIPDAVTDAAQVGMLRAESENAQLKRNTCKRMQL